MNDVIGETLPLALGVAISPIPIIAAILMLLSPRRKEPVWDSCSGGCSGVLVAVVAFTFLASVLPRGGRQRPSRSPARSRPSSWAALLLVLAIKQWRSRPAGDAEPPLPHWMQAIDTMTAGRALVLGFLLSGAEPEEPAHGSCRRYRGRVGRPDGQRVRRDDRRLQRRSRRAPSPSPSSPTSSPRTRWPPRSPALRTWLVHNNSTVMAVLLLVIGVVLVGKGIGSY